MAAVVLTAGRERAVRTVREEDEVRKRRETVIACVGAVRRARSVAVCGSRVVTSPADAPAPCPGGRSEPDDLVRDWAHAT